MDIPALPPLFHSRPLFSMTFPHCSLKKRILSHSNRQENGFSEGGVDSRFRGNDCMHRQPAIDNRQSAIENRNSKFENRPAAAGKSATVNHQSAIDNRQSAINNEKRSS